MHVISCNYVLHSIATHRFCSVLEQNKLALESLGYPSFTLEDFHDNVSVTIYSITTVYFYSQLTCNVCLCAVS